MTGNHEAIESTRRCLFPAEGIESNRHENSPSSRPPVYKRRQETKRQLSPTAVFEYPPLGESTNKGLHSTVVMSDDGAEVTLMVDVALRTPEKRKVKAETNRNASLGTVRNSSLLDIEGTPTSTKIKKAEKQKRSIFAELCCASPGTHYIDDDQYTVTTQEDVESTVKGMLGKENTPPKSSLFCSDWHVWSCSPSPPHDQQNDSNEEEVIDAVRTKLQKRARSMQVRNTRVRQLRRDLSPFGKSPNRLSPQLFRSRSFSVSDHAPAIVRQSKELQNEKMSFASVLQLCTLPEHAVAESPLGLKSIRSKDGDECFYDSDPEDFAKRRSPRRKSKGNRSESLYQTNRSSVRDDYTCKETVQEFFNQSFTLVYHQTDQDEFGRAKARSPVAVDAWLERGQQLDDLIQPKLMWKLKPRYKKRHSRLQKIPVDFVELLNICRVVTPTKVDRSKYPFVKSGHCILLKTIHKEEFCFEAESKERRDDFAFSLKLSVARFGAMVLASDDNVYDEYFALDGYGPGEEPGLFDMVDDSASEQSEEAEC